MISWFILFFFLLLRKQSTKIESFCFKSTDKSVFAFEYFQLDRNPLNVVVSEVETTLNFLENTFCGSAIVTLNQLQVSNLKLFEFHELGIQVCAICFHFGHPTERRSVFIKRNWGLWFRLTERCFLADRSVSIDEYIQVLAYKRVCV